MRTLTITKEAYATLVAHAWKYPHAAVNGILVGKLLQQQSASSASSASSAPAGTASRRDFAITHAFPLFHGQLNLAPMTEFALHQIDTFCKQNQLLIVGYYQAHEFVDNNSMGALATILGDKLRADFADAVVLIVNNRGLLHQDPSKLALSLYTAANNAWRLELDDSNEVRLLPADKDVVPFALEHTAQKKTFRSIVDFQEHLEDVSRDWIDPKLFV